MDNTIVARNFKLLREKLNLTQEQLSEYLEIPRGYVSYYETGQREIPLEILEKASDLFGIDLLDLLEENSEEALTNLSFAFRANELKTEDLQVIAAFKKIVKNVQRMNRLAQNE
jgi:transcriptional regulator with XRE-family HTH domain